MTDNIFISVIICTYNREQYLSKCLGNLANQSLPVTSYEIVLINNCSTDATEEVCHSFRENNPHILFRYITEKKQGLSFARNRGIREAKGDVLAFLDDDAIPSYHYLRQIWLYFRNPKNKALAGGGKILPLYETTEPGWMTRYLMPIVSVIDLGERSRFFPPDRYPIGANMFFRKEAFRKYSGFNTDLGRKGRELLGGEEK